MATHWGQLSPRGHGAFFLLGSCGRTSRPESARIAVGIRRGSWWLPRALHTHS